MYKTYHYDNMPRPVAYNAHQYAETGKTKNKCENKAETRDCKPDAALGAPKCAEICPPPTTAAVREGYLHNIFGLKNDDIIVLIIIFILLLDDCEDKLLLAALGFIFFSGLGERE